MTVFFVTGLASWISSGCGGKVDSTGVEVSGGMSAGGLAQGGKPNRGGASVGAGGTTRIDTGSSSQACEMSGVGDDLFSDQVVDLFKPEHVFFTWTTLEQVSELRQGGDLFSRSERPELGRGSSLEALDNFSASTDSEADIAAILSQKIFTKVRYAWKNPWATRMGWPGEQYGNQLVRIELRETAWLAIFDGESLYFIDMAGKIVVPDDVRLTPERVGAIVFVRSASAGGPLCTTFGVPIFSTFDAIGGIGYREVLLGNLSQVKEFSVGTEEIGQRLTSDIERLEAFKTELEACGAIPYDSNWNATVVCAWELGANAALSPYVHSLAFPNDYYQPSPTTIGAIIETLRADGFVLEPYSVKVE